MALRFSPRYLIPALYFNVFCIGIAQVIISIDLTGWATRLATDLPHLGTVIGAFGIGRLSVYAVFSFFRSRLTARHIVAAGSAFQILYLLTLISAGSWITAAVALFMAGLSAAFFDVGNFPLLCTLYENKAPSLGILTKTVMSFGQLLLPFLLAAETFLFPEAPFTALALVLTIGSAAGIASVLLTPIQSPTTPKTTVSSPWAMTTLLPFLGYSAFSYASFAVVMLWMPFCMQTELGLSAAESRLSLTTFALGSLAAGPVLAWITDRLQVPSRLLWLLPLTAAVATAFAVIFPSHTVMLITSTVVGATTASGVYQLAVVFLCLKHKAVQPQVTGIYLMAGALSSIILSIMLGWLAHTMPHQILSTALICALLCSALGYLCSRRIVSSTEGNVTPHAPS